MALTKPTVIQQVSLPTQKSIPVSTIGGYSILFFGKKKIGKTSLSSQFPEALFLMFEPGAKKLAIYQKPVRNWTEFKQYVKLIQSDTKFKTVVIDVADIAYEFCLQYACRSLNITHPADAPFGKGWNAVSRELSLEINKLLNCGKGVIFISHAKEEEIEERSGRKYSRMTNTMPGQARGMIEGLVDVWACYDYDGKKRTLTIMGDDFIDAGHRLNEPPQPRFLYRGTNEPIRKIPMGSSSKEAYENFIKAFNNQLEKEVSDPVRSIVKTLIRK